MATQAKLGPLSKLIGTWRTPGQGPHDDVEVRLGYGLRHVEQLTEMHGNVRLREFRVTEVEDGWRVMFKGDRRGKPVVAYVYASSYINALIVAITSLDIGKCVWHHDEYPPKRYDKPTVPLRF